MAINLDLSKEVKLDLNKGAGISLNLDKGEYVNLSGNKLDSVRLRAGVGWNIKTQEQTTGLFLKRTTKVQKPIDLDLVLKLVSDGEKVGAVYFGNKHAKGINLDHDDLTGSSNAIDVNFMCNSTAKDNENTTINLLRVNKHIDEIQIAICIYNNYYFEDIDNAYCKLVDETNNRVICSTIMQNDGGRNQTLHFASLKKTDDGQWVFEAVQEYKQGKIGQYLK